MKYAIAQATASTCVAAETNAETAGARAAIPAMRTATPSRYEANAMACILLRVTPLDASAARSTR